MSVEETGMCIQNIDNDSRNRHRLDEGIEEDIDDNDDVQHNQYIHIIIINNIIHILIAQQPTKEASSRTSKPAANKPDRGIFTYFTILPASGFGPGPEKPIMYVYNILFLFFLLYIYIII